MNLEIRALQQKRYDWIQENFMLFAEFKVGDRIYADHQADSLGMQFAGIVNLVYVKKKLRDERVNVYYQFDRAPNYSYHGDTDGGWTTYYDQAAYERNVKWKIESLQRKLAK